MLLRIKLVQIHTAPYNAGIEPVWYSEEKQMPTGIKLVPNTHSGPYNAGICLLYTSPSPRDLSTSRMPSSA